MTVPIPKARALLNASHGAASTPLRPAQLAMTRAGSSRLSGFAITTNACLVVIRHLNKRRTLSLRLPASFEHFEVRRTLVEVRENSPRFRRNVRHRVILAHERLQ